MGSIQSRPDSVLPFGIVSKPPVFAFSRIFAAFEVQSRGSGGSIAFNCAFRFE
ncbi:hypothetical protein NC99_13920 [Sunxiuqinia dokdonensis]|uniref:Uncharacterized protein n=1 Tax=Sunxiuqinia dokdonensis TaxID=1409788 RepID=A0A0L8VBA9_9BACT|nr:hypothetical protein NC99_13920 [Sunxiuqinia dokdonensis]